MAKWKILARHKWVSGAIITESCKVDDENGLRRYTATIRGWQNWKIWQGETAYKEMKPRVDEIIRRVCEIRDRIDAGDKKVFDEPNNW
ncbi:MAG: phage late control D family protein [candidate division KSB1 bacterium]|nr:phage late control D family protein [candidate division KSB1 bacterium]